MRGMRRGSMLLVALWIIAVLSVMVLSFAMEARQQMGINTYVRERNRVNRLIDAGRVLGEVILFGYGDAVEWSEDEDAAELFEKDRWFKEKRALKFESKCTVGPILLDAENPDSGTVKVELALVNSVSGAGAQEEPHGAININILSKEGGDAKYYDRWIAIFRMYGIPEELATQKDGTVNLWNMLIASWDDWRDSDDNVTAFDGEECGAESKWYEEKDEDNRVDEEFRVRPRNGKIPTLHELGKVRGFRDYPAVLIGGVINPWEEKKEQITVKSPGISHLFCTEGTQKVNVNSCDVETLMTIPGVMSRDHDDDAAELDAQELAQAIIDCLAVAPEDRDVEEGRSEYPFKDWDDLKKRLDNMTMSSDVQLGEEAREYFDFGPTESSVFSMRITGESMGMKRMVRAECYVKDKKVRYVTWRED